MRAILIPATVALAITAVASSSTPAPAAGCLKGAVIGLVVSWTTSQPRQFAVTIADQNPLENRNNLRSSSPHLSRVS